MAAFFPITDFQFVFCGFATFAATVGYACAKRRSSVHQDDAPDIEDRAASQTTEPSEYSTSDEKASADTEPMSRKRKSVDDHDSSIRRPRKRSRSPSAAADSSEPASQTEAIAGVPKAICPVSPNGAETTKFEGEEIAMKQGASTPAVVEHTSDPIQSAEDVDKAVEKAATLVTPPPSPSPPNHARGFAAFAGAGSPFMASPFSPNETATSLSPQRPVWRGNGSIFGDPSSPNLSDSRVVDSTAAVPRSVNEAVSVELIAGPNTSEIALAAMETRVKTTITHLTGEEDETVKSELRGVKLFVKRGSKGFTVGMSGHIKLLSRSGCDEERLLFRREPLWKVSMNVRVRPTVRCTFDEEDNVLRVVLKEAVEYGDEAPETRPQELVVYALKRGRVPKKDFKEFAEALLQNPLFKSPTPNGPATTEP